MRRQLAGVTGAVLLIMASSVMSFGQRSGASSTSQGSVGTVQPNPSRSSYPNSISTMPMGSDPSMIPDVGSRITEQQIRSRNAERQKRLETDTDKLVGLATSLKEKVQDEKEMSPADLSKRAEEIEKLARSVKDRMKG